MPKSNASPPRDYFFFPLPFPLPPFLPLGASGSMPSARRRFSSSRRRLSSSIAAIASVYTATSRWMCSAAEHFAYPCAGSQSIGHSKPFSYLIQILPPAIHPDGRASRPTPGCEKGSALLPVSSSAGVKKRGAPENEAADSAVGYFTPSTEPVTPSGVRTSSFMLRENGSRCSC